MSEPAPELPLPGGHINPIVRVGHTVRPPAPKRARFVRRLPHHLERHQWPAAPRFLGIDEAGDIAAPGKRIHDVAHVCWQYFDPGPDVANPARQPGSFGWSPTATG